MIVVPSTLTANDYAGVPGLVLGKLGYHVDITDKNVALPLLEENVRANDLTAMCKACYPEVVFERLCPHLQSHSTLFGTFKR
jgi:hypothetical protein